MAPRTISRLNDGKRRQKSFFSMTSVVQLAIVTALALFVVVNLAILGNLGEHGDVVDQEERLIRAQRYARILRRYPPHRYYKIGMSRKDQPDFLVETDYIHGEWPTILRSSTLRKGRQGSFKIAVDQSEWLMFPNATSTATERMPKRSHASNIIYGPLPFADGTNPSILTMDRVIKRAPEHAKLLRQHYPSTHYILTACMTNSQCSWKDSPQDIEEFHISTLEKPDTVRTVIMLLDRNYQTLAQATLFLEHDARWGRKYRKPSIEADGPVPLKMPAFDDARLFVHAGQVYVSFREGKGFGYESQVLNPIHFHFSFAVPNSNAVQMEAHARASESSTLCCGRNMALMAGDDANHLKAVTWVDPITTVNVDTSAGTNNKGRRLAAAAAGKKKKSHIHGTNAFMVDLPSKQDGTDAPPVFLGMAHFHRPNDRKENPYAKFGHHYTHAFFSIQNDKLVGLSAEFVFPSSYQSDDAEIIQFASGLEYDEERDQLLIAYGINDCEGAITAVDLDTVKRMLRRVDEGKEVLDYMKPLNGS